MVNVNNLTAIENVDSKPIGYLTWYTITNVEKTRDELEAHLSVRNFQEFMPRMISPSDAFRRATAECQRKNVKAASRDVNYNYLMREVYSDNTEIVRHIVIEENDKKVKSLSYDPDTAILRYDKKADRIDFQARTMMAEELCNEAVKLFHKHRVTYNERHIRDVIAEILGNMAPVPVRPSGGVYFVPERYNERLQPFICLVNDLGGSEAFKVPLINTMENKDMIRKHARTVGIPANNISEIIEVLDKTTHPATHLHAEWYYE